MDQLARPEVRQLMTHPRSLARPVITVLRIVPVRPRHSAHWVTTALQTLKHQLNVLQATTLTISANQLALSVPVVTIAVMKPFKPLSTLRPRFSEQTLSHVPLVTTVPRDLTCILLMGSLVLSAQSVPLTPTWEGVPLVIVSIALKATFVIR